MLNKTNLEQFTKRLQTDAENVVREYCQHLFLSFLYQQSGSEHLLFKGGTALRIIFRSPRFSEDLDFTGSGIRQKEVEELFAGTMLEIERTGVKVDIAEGKPATGGYLGIAEFSVYDQDTQVAVEVSLRNGGGTEGVRTLVETDYLPPYTVVQLSQEEIVGGKMQALLSRKKPRDFYDLYFLLRANLVSEEHKKKLREALEALHGTHIRFDRELKRFLPKSHWPIIREFPRALEREIQRCLP